MSQGVQEEVVEGLALLGISVYIDDIKPEVPTSWRCPGGAKIWMDQDEVEPIKNVPPDLLGTVGIEGTSKPMEMIMMPTVKQESKPEVKKYLGDADEIQIVVLNKNGKPKQFPRNKLYPCTECRMSYNQKLHIVKHMVQEHAIPIQCTKCEDKFTAWLSYMQHRKRSHPSHICTMCGVAKPDKYHLNIHIETKHNDDEANPKEVVLNRNGKPKQFPKNKGYPCTHCRMSYKQSLVLNRHMLKEHDTPIQCKKCEDKFTDWSSYMNHRKKSHPTFICTICGIAKSEKCLLDHHIEVKHEANVACERCGIVCTSRRSLWYHIDRSHSEKVKQKCTKCDYQTHMPREMRGHFRRRHTDDFKETCHHCGEIFKVLKRHLKRTGCGGEGEGEMFPCAQCYKKFNFRKGLDSHVKRTHTGIKDRKCMQCSYATYSGYNLRLHMDKIHLGKKVVKQSCQYCDKVTTNLDYHIDIMHNEHFVAKSQS